MKILNISNKDVYFYLALEEYLIKNSEEEYFILWGSDDCVVCGKHQNIFEEINLQYITNNNIKLARRLSGGGTVFIDKGNLNFAFILNKTSGKQIDFIKHTKPIFKYLKSLNIDVKYSQRFDMFIDNMKFSGNAEHIYKNRVLHHGTLLFNSDLKKLEQSIKINNGYNSNAVKSVRKKVTNINSYTNNITFNDFKIGLYDFIKNYYNKHSEYLLKKETISNIELLANTKFSTQNWILNYSPKFTFSGSIKTKQTNITFKLYVENGIINNCNFVNNKEYEELFLNKEYNIYSINNIIRTNNLDTIFKIDSNKLLYCFF